MAGSLSCYLCVLGRTFGGMAIPAGMLRACQFNDLGRITDRSRPYLPQMVSRAVANAPTVFASLTMAGRRAMPRPSKCVIRCGQFVAAKPRRGVSLGIYGRLSRNTQSKGARLYLFKAKDRTPVWIIRDGQRTPGIQRRARHGTSCSRPRAAG